jgi:hypothetical protein
MPPTTANGTRHQLRPFLNLTPAPPPFSAMSSTPATLRMADGCDIVCHPYSLNPRPPVTILEADADGVVASACVKVFGCRPFTGVYRRAEAGPAFENLQGRKPRVGRAAIRRRELWGFERRRRVLAGRWKEGQSRFRRMARCAGAFSVGDGIGFFAADVVMIGARSIFGRAPSAPSSDPRR